MSIRRYEFRLFTVGYSSDHEMVPDADGDWVRFEEAEALVRRAWEAGFTLCRQYGDNHPHFDGEQKEYQWTRFLEDRT